MALERLAMSVWRFTIGRSEVDGDCEVQLRPGRHREELKEKERTVREDQRLVDHSADKHAQTITLLKV